MIALLGAVALAGCGGGSAVPTVAAPGGHEGRTVDSRARLIARIEEADGTEELSGGGSVLDIHVRVGAPPEVRCWTNSLALAEHEDGAAWSCDEALARCTSQHVVLRFRRGRHGPILVAAIWYEGATPDVEPPQIVASIDQRARRCELHDRIARRDASLFRLRRLVVRDRALFDNSIATRLECDDEAIQSFIELTFDYSSWLCCIELACWTCDGPGEGGHVVLAGRDDSGSLEVRALLLEGTRADAPSTSRIERLLRARCR